MSFLRRHLFSFIAAAILCGIGAATFFPAAWAARNSFGVHSLPAGNPVVSGTTISSTVQNATMSDISTEITNSLDRGGRGAMTAGLPGFAGTVSLPGYAFTGDLDTGVYRIGANNLGIAVNGVKAVDVATTGTTFPQGLVCTQSQTNTAGLVSTGNGTQPGVTGTGGITGTGVNGVGGATSGSGVKGTGTAGNSLGVEGVGQGSASGVKGTGGATGAGIEGVGQASASGVKGTGGATDGTGVMGTAGGDGIGVKGVDGASGYGVWGENTSSGTGGYFISASGPALRVHTGNAYFSANNPAATTGFTNKVTPANITKAWGTFTTTTGPNAVALSSGFNVTSVALSGNDVVVTIADDMANANYAVVSNNLTADQRWTVAHTRAVGSFSVSLYQVAGQLNFTGTAATISFVVYGLQ